MSRVKSKAICYLGPLPDDLPKPAYLKAELQGVCIVKRIRRTLLPNVTAEKKRFANLMSCSVLVPVSSTFLYPVHGSCHTGIKECIQQASRQMFAKRVEIINIIKKPQGYVLCISVNQYFFQHV